MVYTTSFDGANDTLLSSLDGWVGGYGYYNVLKLNGAGALKHDAYSDDGSAVTRSADSADHYVKVVVGEGFIGSNGGVGITIAFSNLSDNLMITYQSSTLTTYYNRYGGLGTIAGSTLVAGDEVEIDWNATTRVLTVKRNGAVLSSGPVEELNGTQSGQNVGIILSFPGRSATDDIFRYWESGDASGDVTKPILTLPTVAATSSTSATGGVTTTEAGPAWSVITNSSTKPTATQIKLGQNNTGAAALSADTATLALGANASAFNFGGLTPDSTGLYMHTVQDDEADPPNTSDVVTSGPFNTPAPPPRCALVLTTDGSTPAANLSGLSWCWWDSAAPNLSTAPKASGTGATTSVTGVFDVLLTGSSLVSGQVGRLLVYSGNGVPGNVSNTAFCGPVTVS